MKKTLSKTEDNEQYGYEYVIVFSLVNYARLLIKIIVHNISEHKHESSNLEEVNHIPALEIVKSILLDLYELNE